MSRSWRYWFLEVQAICRSCLDVSGGFSTPDLLCRLIKVNFSQLTKIKLHLDFCFSIISDTSSELADQYAKPLQLLGLQLKILWGDIIMLINEVLREEQRRPVLSSGVCILIRVAAGHEQICGDNVQPRLIKVILLHADDLSPALLYPWSASLTHAGDSTAL